jgi:tRNA (guanine-N7-)-methyltransferase
MQKKPFTETPGQRQIRSFVLRQGRQTDAQKRAFDLHWSQHGIDYQGRAREFHSLFAKPAPLVVEIGFGNAEQLIFSAGNEPDKNFIGIEVHGPGVGRALNAIAEQGLNNVRVYQHDAVELFQQEFADQSLSEVRVYFPDPWHKKRHQKRRLLNSQFVHLICQKLKPNGLLHLATDWENYAEQMREICEAESLLNNEAGAGASVARPTWRQQTHFETRGMKLGHGVWDFLYRRTDQQGK